MKLVVALGIAAATTAMAYAQEPHAMRVMIGGPGMDLNLDANHDGWISRDEAAAAADRMFDQLDTNHDGRLTADDHRDMGDHMFMMHGPDGVELPPGHHCTTTTDNTQSSDSGHRTERRVTIVCDGGGDDHPAAAPAAPGQHVERNVMIITRSDGDAPAPPAPPHPPMPPHPPHAPMFMMLLADSSEADRNGDGALSRDEFRAQQLRFFDAADANGDHRIRAPAPPPEPPQPPEPPEPPAPPAPH